MAFKGPFQLKPFYDSIFPLHQFADLASQTAVPAEVNGHPGMQWRQDSSAG